MTVSKKKLKKYSLISLSLIFLYLPIFSTQAVFDPKPTVFDSGNKILRNTRLGNASPVVLISGIINWTLGVLGLFSLCLILYAGFIWMWARGNEEEIKKAQEILKGAIIGLVLVLASYGIASFIFDYLLNITEASWN